MSKDKDKDSKMASRDTKKEMVKVKQHSKKVAER